MQSLSPFNHHCCRQLFISPLWHEGIISTASRALMARCVPLNRRPHNTRTICECAAFTLKIGHLDWNKTCVAISSFWLNEMTCRSKTLFCKSFPAVNKSLFSLSSPRDQSQCSFVKNITFIGGLAGLRLLLLFLNCRLNRGCLVLISYIKAY